MIITQEYRFKVNHYLCCYADTCKLLCFGCLETKTIHDELVFIIYLYRWFPEPTSRVSLSSAREVNTPLTGYGRNSNNLPCLVFPLGAFSQACLVLLYIE